MEAQYSSEAVVFVGKIQRRVPQKAIASSVTARVFLLCSCIRRERTVAKSDYWLRHFRPSYRPHITARLPVDEFLSNLILGTSTKVSWETPNLVEIEQSVWHFTQRPECVSYIWQRHMYVNDKRERRLAFSWQQWLRERATLLRYTYIVCFLYL